MKVDKWGTESIVTKKLHEFFAGRSSGSWSRQSIKNLVQRACADGQRVDGDELFEVIIAIAEEAYVEGRRSVANDYRHALLELRRMNHLSLDSLAVEGFIERHCDEAGIVEFYGLNGMATSAKDKV